MAAKYQIPETHILGFQLLGKLSKSDISLICKSLNTFNSDEGLNKLVIDLEGKTYLNEKNLRVLLTTIFSLKELLNDEENKIEEIVADLTISYIDELTESENKENDGTVFSSNLLQILQTDGSLTKTIKAYGLLNDNEKIYLKSRILTDIRLVFDNDTTVKPDEAVLLHQLKIVYNQTDGTKEIFIALDSNDLIDLKDSISRAIEKEKIIYSNTFNENITFIKPKK